MYFDTTYFTLCNFKGLTKVKKCLKYLYCVAGWMFQFQEPLTVVLQIIHYALMGQKAVVLEMLIEKKGVFSPRHILNGFKTACQIRQPLYNVHQQQRKSHKLQQQTVGFLGCLH